MQVELSVVGWQRVKRVVTAILVARWLIAALPSECSFGPPDNVLVAAVEPPAPVLLV